MQSLPIPTADWLALAPMLLPLLGAAVLLVLRGRPAWAVPVALLVVAVTGVADLALLQRVAVNGPLAMTMGRWLPPFGISFTADLMGTLFAGIAAIVALACFVTATVEGNPADRPTFFALALVLLAGVDGAFLTGDFFNLYVWFEVMLAGSFGLLVISGTPAALDGALKYGLLNFLGTSLFLLGLGLLYGLLGTLNMADVLGAAKSANPAAMTSVAALLLLAFAAKAAAFPINAWLPASYHTPPAVVSALLGGSLTKVGVYALARTLALLPESRTLLEPAIALVAGTTLLAAPLGALAETNLRRLIGFLLVGGVGVAVSGLALGGPGGFAGAIAYVANAMLTIAALYLVAGLIERASGETDIRRMAGLYRARPGLAALFGLLLLTVAGVPPFLGFWPKLLLVEAAAGRLSATFDWSAVGLVACLLLNALLTLTVGARLWGQVFWRPGADSDVTVAALSTPAGVDGALAVAVALVALITVLGLWPQPLLQAGRDAAASLLDPARYVSAVGLAGTGP